MQLIAQPNQVIKYNLNNMSYSKKTLQLLLKKTQVKKIFLHQQNKVGPNATHSTAKPSNKI